MSRYRTNGAPFERLSRRPEGAQHHGVSAESISIVLAGRRGGGGDRRSPSGQPRRRPRSAISMSSISSLPTPSYAPTAALIQATDGNFYGTTRDFGAGMIFRMTPAGTVTILHAFRSGAMEGADAAAPLIQASDGNFYGTTASGGASNRGTVFKMTPAGAFTLLHAFTAMEGSGPTAALVEATDGNFYGSTPAGPSAAGTVFMMTPGGVVTVLHTFTGLESGSPSGLIQASDGNFYGTLSNGSLASIFRMSSTGSVTILHTFPAGAGPGTSLIQASDGALYGATSGNLPLRRARCSRSRSPAPSPSCMHSTGVMERLRRPRFSRRRTATSMARPAPAGLTRSVRPAGSARCSRWRRTAP